MKVAINTCYGGFSLSRAACEHMADCGHKGAREHLAKRDAQADGYKGWFDYRPDDRTDPLVIEAIELLGTPANGRSADLKVVEVPDEVKWTIEEYDGVEWVAEEHRTWS